MYTNHTQRLYGVCHNLLNVVAFRTQEPVADYVSKVSDLFHEFNEYYLLPLLLLKKLSNDHGSWL